MGRLVRTSCEHDVVAVAVAVAVAVVGGGGTSAPE